MSDKKLSEISYNLVEKFADLLEKKNLAEIEVSSNDFSIKISKNINHKNFSSQEIFSSITEPKKLETTKASSQEDLKTHKSITSPMVGTVYRSSTPGEKPFISIGSIVKKGDKLLRIEAMKTFNEIKSPYDGVIKDILIEDKKPVEFGTTLIILE